MTSLVSTAVTKLRIGAPDSGAELGPIANAKQFERVRQMIDSGIREGATLAAGGLERPGTVESGYFVRPTVFSNVSRSMTFANEEVFGPVLAIMPYSDLDEAIDIVNDTNYGLSGYVWGEDPNRTSRVADELQVGMVHINGAPLDAAAPFGGVKMSGIGREWGVYGLEEFLEPKSVFGT